MDNILIITLLTIFATAFIGTIIKYRLRDKCLRDFRGYLVNLEYHDGRRLWGSLNVFHNGMELTYPTPLRDPADGHLETSALVFQSQMGTVRALKRFHDELSPDNQARRQREVALTQSPGLFRRFWRQLRNVFNLLRDAFGQAVTLFIGTFKKQGASTLLSTQDARINNTAQQVIAQGSAAYEPILERYIGKHVVVEITHNGVTKKNVGLFKEYSDQFLMVLDVPVSEAHAFNLADPEQLRVNRDFDFEVTQAVDNDTIQLHVRFHNRSRKSVDLLRVEGAGVEQALNLHVEAAGSTTFELKSISCPPADDETPNTAPSRAMLPPLHLLVSCRRQMDLIVPRAIAVVRHGAG